MRFNEISESTTAGSISSVSMPLGEVQKRTPSKKSTKNGPYANSISEGKQVDEAELAEDDIIMVPGKGLKVKPGFHKIDPDKAEHEGQTLKNSLHTIIRVATHLDKELSVRDNFPEWVSEKIGAVKSNMVTVMDYLISAKEMQHDPDAMSEGFGSRYAEQLAKQVYKHNPDLDTSGRADRLLNVGYSIAKSELGSRAQGIFRDEDFPSDFVSAYSYLQKWQGVVEGEKVDRMVKHIAKSERNLGHSKKEAENIAWATANKRGYLNNKNKKKH